MFIQIHLGSLGLTYVHLCSLWFILWLKLGYIGFSWVHLVSLGHARVKLGSLGFPLWFTEVFIWLTLGFTLVHTRDPLGSL